MRTHRTCLYDTSRYGVLPALWKGRKTMIVTKNNQKPVILPKKVIKGGYFRCRGCKSVFWASDAEMQQDKWQERLQNGHDVKWALDNSSLPYVGQICAVCQQWNLFYRYPRIRGWWDWWINVPIGTQHPSHPNKKGWPVVDIVWTVGGVLCLLTAFVIFCLSVWGHWS